MALFGKTNTAAPVPRRDEIFTPHTIAGFPRGIFNRAVNRIFSWPKQGPTGVNHAFRQIVARGKTLCLGQVVACSAGKSAGDRHRNRKIHQRRFRHQPAIESTTVGDATKLPLFRCIYCGAHRGNQVPRQDRPAFGLPL